MKSKNSGSSAFTLIEMLTVMAVIAVLASLIVSVNGYAHKKSALVRAEGEIKTMAASCESYRSDNGSYPRDSGGVTDALDPRVDGDPTSTKYKNASLQLYMALSGDTTLNLRPTGKGYFEFRPDHLKMLSSGLVGFLSDPFGNSYGYSTAGAKSEEAYRESLQKDPTTPRPTGNDLKGFSPTFDLWSTGGTISKVSDPGQLNLDRKTWVKNW